MKPWEWPEPYDWMSAILVACIIWFGFIAVSAWLL